MTRINTNVSSLVGRNNLNRANASLSQSLTRLSTGLRINTGKDDPAGLIASENLRSDITAIRRAISNTDRANQVIATADSALGQVSSLLNDIRGLVTESANSGALSAEQIAANQLQVDSSLEALNRIAQTTTFQGRRLLDGSLDFTTNAGSEFGRLSDLQIDQANLGATGQVSVDIDVTTAATRASLDITGVTTSVSPVNSVGTLTFSDSAVGASGSAVFERQVSAAQPGTGTINLSIEDQDSTQGVADIDIDAQATGSFTFNSTTGESLTITALEGGNADGDATIAVVLVDGNGTPNGVDSAVYNGTDTITITADLTSGNVSSNDIATAIAGINGGADFTATGGTANTLVAGDATTYSNAATGGGNQTFTVTAVQNQDADGAEISALNSPSINFTFGAGSDSAAYNAGTDSIDVNLTGAAGSRTIAEVAALIAASGDFTVDTSGVTNTASTFGSTAAGAAGVTVTSDGADATAVARTIDITSVAGANNDFNITIDSSTYTAAQLTAGADFDSGDGILAGLTGNATQGYTVYVASDAATNINNIAKFIQDNIDEAASVSTTAGPAEVLNPTRGAEVPPSGATSVNGSQAATTATETINIAVDASQGVAGNLTINFQLAAVSNPGATTALLNNGNGSYTVVIDSNEATVDFTDIRDELNNIAGVTATYGGASSFDTAVDTATQGNTVLTGGRDAGDDVITVTAASASSAFDGDIIFNTANSEIGGIDVTVANGDITVSVDSSSSYSLADIAAAINDLTNYNASVTTSNGSGTYDANDADDDTIPVVGALTGGQAASGGISTDAVIELAGINGSEVFNLRAGTGIQDLVTQINLVSDATGVQASQSGTTLQLRSTAYGSNALVDLTVKEEAGSTGTFKTAVGEGQRETGTDVVATVNGVAANGDGNQLSINTATLDLTTSIEADFIGTVEFDITGGGALFQLGPDVVSNQQARLGINSVNTAALGGVSGNLFQLASGGTADLTTDSTTAARIVEEAIDQVTSLRGRLGAFQRTTLETNKNALNDTLSNLTEAESSIRDADFAEETASLTRSQILVQSGTRVLAIANQNPQNVLALLG